MLNKALLLGVLTAAASFAAPITYTASMSGLNENLPNASPSTGFATVIVDQALHTINVSLIFSGLIGGNVGSGHIHCCTAPNGNTGVALPFSGLPAATSGSYNPATFDMTLTATYQAGFLTANGGTAASAEAALDAGIGSGLAYVNLHNSAFPGGELRGFLTLATPEPGTFGLMGAAVLGLGFLRRKK